MYPIRTRASPEGPSEGPSSAPEINPEIDPEPGTEEGPPPEGERIAERGLAGSGGAAARSAAARAPTRGAASGSDVARCGRDGSVRSRAQRVWRVRSAAMASRRSEARRESSLRERSNKSACGGKGGYTRWLHNVVTQGGYTREKLRERSN